MLLKSALSVVFVTIVAIAAAQAQDLGQTPQPQPQPPRQPVVAPQPPPPGPGSAPQPAVAIDPPRRPRGRDLNVQIEITITDQTGSAPAEKKVVSLIAADQTMGRIRANAEANKPNLGRVGSNLNVDARPMVLEGDRLLLELTLEYTPLRDSDVIRPTNLNESLSVILTNGKPITISQAADPISDRRMTVEVKATVLK